MSYVLHRGNRFYGKEALYLELVFTGIRKPKEGAQWHARYMVLSGHGPTQFETIYMPMPHFEALLFEGDHKKPKGLWLVSMPDINQRYGRLRRLESWWPGEAVRKENNDRRGQCK